MRVKKRVGMGRRILFHSYKLTLDRLHIVW